jgi:hypothetical protein
MEDSKDILLDSIESLRQEMIHTGTIRGYNSPETIAVSQMLDQLILMYQQLIH